MKYFTRERYLALQVDDEAAMDAADADWNDAADCYEAYLQLVRPDLSKPIRQLLDGFNLHDARVLSIGRRGETLTISVLLDFAQNKLLTITYTLAGSPEVKKEPFRDGQNTSSPWWLYEEIEQVEEGDQSHFIHSILLSNGWEARIPFREVHMDTADPVFPLLRQRQVAIPAGASQSATN